MPAFRPIVLAPEWRPYACPLADFQPDGSDIQAISIVRVQTAGRFQFDLDQSEIQ